MIRFANPGLPRLSRYETGNPARFEKCLLVIAETECHLEAICGPGYVLFRTIQDHRQALDQLESTITLELLKQAAELIVSADTLYVFGEGSARAPVLELSFWLRRLGIDVVDISDTGRNFFEKIVHLTKNDAALAFGYRSKNQEVDILLKEIRERGGRTILVTDRALTNAVQYADVVLRTARGKIGEFASMAIPVIIADALLVTVAKLEPERLEHLKSLEALRSRYGFS